VLGVLQSLNHFYFGSPPHGSFSLKPKDAYDRRNGLSQLLDVTVGLGGFSILPRGPITLLDGAEITYVGQDALTVMSTSDQSWPRMKKAISI
jgi:hypothetical protein